MRLRSFRRLLLTRAFWILGGFTLLFVVSLPPVGSQPLRPAPIMWPARAGVALGAIFWTLMLLLSVRAFLIPAERPAFVTTFFFFLLFAAELLCVAFVVL